MSQLNQKLDIELIVLMDSSQHFYSVYISPRCYNYSHYKNAYGLINAPCEPDAE